MNTAKTQKTLPLSPSAPLRLCVDNLDAIMLAPDGIKKLRELILQLAVQGRLTQQLPEDGNARDLLEEIKKAKRRDAETRRGNGQRIQKPKKLPPIKADEIPFEIPENWEWVRLGEVFEFQYGKSLPAKKRNEDGLHPVYGSNGIVGQHDRYLSASPAIIIGRKGSAGALNKCMTPSWTTDVAYFVSPPEQINFDYAFTLLKSSQLENLSKGIKPGINRNEAYELVVPLPPLQEQKRIVAQVDKLMAYCDELQAAKERERECQASLCESAFTVLERSSDDQELSKHWNFCAENFQALEQTPENVSKLRNTILQLAVQGRLTRQLPEDGNARDLLEEIKEAKRRDAETRRGNGQRIQKPKKLPPIKADEIPFEIPESWEWVRLGNCTYAITKGSTPTSSGYRFQSSGIPFIKVENIRNGAVIHSSIKHFVSEAADKAQSRSRLENGDVLFSIAGTIGTTCVVNEIDVPSNINQALAIIRSDAICFDSRFLRLQLNSVVSDAIYARARGGAMNNVSLGDLRNLAVTLPPLPEQKRIVAQVDKLMAYCDELEAGFRKREEGAGSFCKAVVAGAGVG